jgi:hypothetical protein
MRPAGQKARRSARKAESFRRINAEARAQRPVRRAIRSALRAKTAGCDEEERQAPQKTWTPAEEVRTPGLAARPPRYEAPPAISASRTFTFSRAAMLFW